MIKCEFENGARAELRHVTVDTIIVKGKKIMLGRRGIVNGKPMLEAGKWGLIGGFMQRNETLAETAKREAMEETGWEITNLVLFRLNDNPKRSNEDRQNVNVVFIAEAKQKNVSGDEEVSELKWFGIDNLPPKDQIAFDHASSLELYKKYLTEKFDLPFFG
jgi:8-oxo-dGTP diphosphatase